MESGVADVDIRQNLFANQDEKYKAFSSKLVTSKYEMIGVRLPVLRQMAKSIEDENQIGTQYFEEIMLRGFVVAKFKSYAKVENHLQYIDSWSTCDSFVSSLKFIKKDKDGFIKHFEYLMHSENEYEKRFFLVCLLNYYVDDVYIDYVLDVVKHIVKDSYTVKMACGWCLQKCYIDHSAKVLEILKFLDKDTLNMTISKICDSLKIEQNAKNIAKEYKKYLQNNNE